ncbi:MAG: hypothetical protein ACOZQL_38840 [Myxococcota bacterium]
MHRTLSLLLLLSWTPFAQPSPSSPRAPAAPRPSVADVLRSDDPLETRAPSTPTPTPSPGDAHAHHHHHAPEPTEVVDPVCGMKLDPSTAGGGSLVEGGKTVHFCSSACRRKYLAGRDGGAP